MAMYAEISATVIKKMRIKPQKDSSPPKKKRDYIQTVKVIDGIFIGGSATASDDAFIHSNKIGYIINCCPDTEVENHFKNGHIHYLNLGWKDTKKYPRGIEITSGIITKIFTFIQTALDRNSVILIHSNSGMTRCILVCVVFFMKKFKWSMTKSIEYMYLLRPNLSLNPSIITQLRMYEKISKKHFISYDWEEIDLEGEYKNEEILLSNTYLNIINNMQKKNTRKASKDDEQDLKSKYSSEPRVKWVDKELNQNLATLVPENFKRNNKSPFISLGEIDPFVKNPKYNEKSVPISDIESEDHSSIAVPRTSIKKVRRKRQIFFPNPIASPQKRKNSAVISEMSKRSKSVLGLSTDDHTPSLNSKEPYRESERTVYGYIKLPGNTSKFSRNPHQKPFNFKKQKIDKELLKNLEERRNQMSKTQNFYLCKKRNKVKYNFSNLEKKISIMEMVPKSNNYIITPPDEDLSTNLSTWSSTLKNKKRDSKAEIRAKLALLRSHSEDRAKRRCLQLNTAQYHPFYNTPSNCIL
ncbi:unnamed protein product [Moneuplotes crassus]|uniref:Tyrosine-protein phosphatase domain-containing protein n=1 Tax=Euplotes crassus TaxID=5936 RepID=A0AAD1X7N6_EUPCR|nr:unnamed protein product [Moneuplotes crassus]